MLSRTGSSNLAAQRRPCGLRGTPTKPAGRLAVVEGAWEQLSRLGGGRGAAAAARAEPPQRAGDFAFDGELCFVPRRNTSGSEPHLRDLLEWADASPDPVVAGCDTETKVVWRKGARVPPSLLQLCYHPPRSPQPVAVLLSLGPGGPDAAARAVLAHPNVLKVGVGIPRDAWELAASYPEVRKAGVQSVIDLSWLAHECGKAKPLPRQLQQQLQESQAQGHKVFPKPEDWGLAGLLEATWGLVMRKNRRITVSDWSKPRLSPQQLQYAAADAYAGLLIFQSLHHHWLQRQPEWRELSPPGAGADQPWQRLPWWQEQGEQRWRQRRGGEPPGPHSHLTSAEAWADYPPAAALRERWLRQVLLPGAALTQAQLDQFDSSAASKADAGEEAGWSAEEATGGGAAAVAGAYGSWGEFS